MPLPLCLQKFTIGRETVELFVPDAEAVRKAYQPGQTSFPYWSRVWPAALALSDFIVQHVHCVEKKTILELGAGLGLPSLVAARFARRVLCTDGSTDAFRIVARSAAHLRLQNIDTAMADWNDLPVDEDTDVLLLSDVAYDPGSFGSLLKRIDAYLHNGTTVLISMPQRLQSKEFALSLLHDCVQQEEYTIKQWGACVPLTVMALKRGAGEPVAQHW